MTMTRTTWLRLALALAVIAAVVAFFALDLGRYLSFARLQDSRGELQRLAELHPLLAPAAYVGLFVAATALCLPVVIVLGLLGGTLFGLWPGLGLIALSTTLGGALAFLGARFLFRDWVHAHYRARYEKVDAGLTRHGPLYLFMLRLLPILPFFVTNLVFGLTSIRLWVFCLVTLLGLLPILTIYANAGMRLGEIDSPAQVFSWPVLASLAALGVFPLAVHKLAEWLRSR